MRRLIALLPADSRRLHFLRIGRTGGTAIRGDLQDIHDNDTYVLDMRDHHTTLRDIRKGKKVVFFLRDPLSRFVSGFFPRNTKSRPRYQSHWNTTEERVFATFDSPDDLALALTDCAGARCQLALEAMFIVKQLVRYNRRLVLTP